MIILDCRQFRPVLKERFSTKITRQNKTTRVPFSAAREPINHAFNGHYDDKEEGELTAALVARGKAGPAFQPAAEARRESTKENRIVGCASHLGSMHVFCSSLRIVLWWRLLPPYVIA
jgi:hypothetical protein